MKTKKLLSLLLALMMMLSVVPFYASAADPIKLSKSNVKIIPPVAEPSISSYGISYSEIAVTGGTLWYVADDGTETLVPGKFSWFTAGTNPINVGTYTPMLKFEPEDQTAYSKISLMSKSTTTIVSGEWPTVTITGTPTPRISEVPTVSVVEGITKTYGEATIKGGTAVDKDTNAKIPGTFVIADEYKEMDVESGAATRIRVRFIPDNLEAYTDMATAEVLVLIKKSIKFVDSNGTSTIPEITVPYGLKMGDDIGNYLKSYLNTSASFNFTETQYYNEYIPVGTHDLTVIASCNDSNYESPAVLPFKLTVEPVEAAVTVKYDINKDNKNTYELYVVKADVDGARPQGNFAIYVDGKLLKDGAKYSEHITWSPEKSKAYAVKVVYTPTANDPCLVADVVSTIDAKLYRKVTTINTSADGEKEFRCGEVIRIVSNIPEFSGWVITDAAGNTVDLGIDTTTATIEFAVPDYDITIEAKGSSSTGGDDSTGGIFDGLGDLAQGDSDNPIVNIFNNIIAWFKNIINTIIELFRSIGDNS